MLEEIKANPPAPIISFVLGDKKTNENKLMEQINGFGKDIVSEDKFGKYLKNDKIKSVTRLRDKAKIK